jgi:hypothetical protein
MHIYMCIYIYTAWALDQIPKGWTPGSLKLQNPGKAPSPSNSYTVHSYTVLERYIDGLQLVVNHDPWDNFP